MTKIIKYTLKQRFTSTSFLVMGLLSIIISVIVNIVPFLTRVNPNWSLAPLNYFFSALFMIYMGISAYAIINRKITTGEMLLFHSKPFTRKNIAKASVTSVLIDCFSFWLFNLIASIAVFMIISIFYWNQAETFGSKSLILHTQIPTILWEIFVVYLLMLLVAIVFILPIIFAAYIANSPVLVFAMAIGLLLSMTVVTTLLGILVLTIFKPTSEFGKDRIGEIIGLFDPRYWIFILYGYLFPSTNIINGGTITGIAPYVYNLKSDNLIVFIFYNIYLFLVLFLGYFGTYILYKCYVLKRSYK